jgi:hypothetical protein
MSNQSFHYSPDSEDFKNAAVTVVPSNAFDSSYDEPTYATSSLTEFQIFVDIEKTMTFWVDDFDKVQDLKQQIRAKADIHPSHQILKKGGKELKDEMTMAQCSINKHDKLMLTMRLPGGGPKRKFFVSVADMKAQESDPPLLKAVFSLDSFKSRVWLTTLNKEQMQSYLTSLEGNRNSSSHLRCTLNMITELAQMKANDIMSHEF